MDESRNSTATEAPRNPTAAEALCFEAGIKFGSLYHQFAGTPVSPASAGSLATAMEDAIENQPHCRSVTVDVREAALAAAVEDAAADYVELTGRFLDVEILVVDDDCEVRARMEMDDGYPLMRIVSVRNGSGRGVDTRDVDTRDADTRDADNRNAHGRDTDAGA